jgi:hypothetical protein
VTLSTIHFDIDVLARSSIVHREDYTAAGTDNFALFRREKIITPTGEVMQIPIVSGSSFRGILRGIGEALTAGVLDYENAALPIPAAHLLTNGGRLAKSARPLTDEEERRLKTLLPQIAVFGGVASGRIMSGLLTVGKVLPEFAELAHILPRPPRVDLRPHIDGVAEESFSHLSDHRTTSDQPPYTDQDEHSSPLGRFGVEPSQPAPAYKPGCGSPTPPRSKPRSCATSWPLSPITATSAAASPPATGRITATVTANPLRGHPPDERTDWAAELAAHRDDAITALSKLT